MIAILLTELAWACAGLVHAEGLQAESAAQEAYFEAGDGETTVTYRVTWSGDAPDFGWLVPFRGGFLSLADADPALFDALRDKTAPLVERRSNSSSSSAGGCGSGKSLKSDGSRSTPGSANDVSVIAEGFTGTYDYVVLAAEDGAALTGWLEENGWQLGGEAGALDAYAAEGFQLLAMRLLPDLGGAGSAETVRTLPAVSLRYEGTDLRFPSRMAMWSEASRLRTTLWVKGEAVADTTGWRTEDLTWLVGDARQDPAEVFEEGLQELAGDEPVFARTWSGEHEDAWLTRLDTWALREAHAEDVVLQLTAPMDDQSLTLRLGGGGAAAMALPLGLLWFAGRRRVPRAGRPD